VLSYIQDYIEKNNQAPSQQEQDELEKYSDQYSAKFLAESEQEECSDS
jgi:hypothetical protein